VGRLGRGLKEGEPQPGGHRVSQPHPTGDDGTGADPTGADPLGGTAGTDPASGNLAEAPVYGSVIGDPVVGDAAEAGRLP
jgi:hypothetical protein